MDLKKFASISSIAKVMIDQNNFVFSDNLTEDEFTIFVNAVNVEDFVLTPGNAIQFLKACIFWSANPFFSLIEKALLKENDVALNCEIVDISSSNGIILQNLESFLAKNLSQYIKYTKFIQFPLYIIYRILTWYHININNVSEITQFVMNLFSLHGKSATPIFNLINISQFSDKDLYYLIFNSQLDLDLVGSTVHQILSKHLSSNTNDKKLHYAVENSRPTPEIDIYKTSLIQRINAQSAYLDSSFVYENLKSERALIESTKWEYATKIESIDGQIQKLRNDNNKLQEYISRNSRIKTKAYQNKTEDSIQENLTPSQISSPTLKISSNHKVNPIQQWDSEKVMNVLKKAKTFPQFIPSIIHAQIRNYTSVEKNIFFDYIWKRIEENDPDACFAYGTYLANIDNNSHDLAACLLRKAVQRGDNDAAFNLAILLLKENNIKDNFILAAQYLANAAINGHEETNNFLNENC